MKKKLFPIAAFVLLLSSGSFAQTAPGDSGDGEGYSDPDSLIVIRLQPPPVYFKRNNGNGTCGGVAEIRVYFSAFPDYPPTIEEIRSEARAVTGVVINDIDASEFTRKGYISYCISSADIIPAVKLWIRFHYEKSGQDFWVTESLNPVQSKGGDH